MVSRDAQTPILRNWWSASNPPSPLQSAAKPLLRRLYRRQARAFIKVHRMTPLTRENIDVLLSYLGSQHVFSATRVSILKELLRRSYDSEQEARMILRALDDEDALLHDLPRCSEVKVRQHLIKLLGFLVEWGSLPPSSSIAEVLVSCISDKDLRLQALDVVYRIVGSEPGACMLMDAGLLRDARPALYSSDVDSRIWASQVLGSFASHPATRSAALALKPYERLVDLLDSKEARTCIAAIYALSQLSIWFRGAAGAVKAGAVPKALSLIQGVILGPRDNDGTCTRHGMLYACAWACELFRNVAAHRSLANDIATYRPFVHMVHLLARIQRGDFGLPAYGLEHMHLCALRAIERRCASSPRHALELVAAGLLDSELASVTFECAYDPARIEAAAILAALAEHGQVVQVLGVRPGQYLLPSIRKLAQDPVADVRSLGVQALAWMSEWSGPMEHFLNPTCPILHEVPVPGETSEQALASACYLHGNIAAARSKTSISVEYLNTNNDPCRLPMSCLRMVTEDPEVYEMALHCLVNLCKSHILAQRAVADHNLLDLLPLHLRSSHCRTQFRACEVLEQLLDHSSTGAEVFKSRHLVQELMYLMGDADNVACGDAALLLAKIGQTAPGMRALQDAGFFKQTYINATLRSRHPEVKSCLGMILLHAESNVA
ncbi:hypothetical protein MKEN_00473400 [Mycena kentingensis (nom. inval.)]|nr:hypothetical protein MKEN_00473400 [Mycena kentingensis (nom. inval.)]